MVSLDIRDDDFIELKNFVGRASSSAINGSTTQTCRIYEALKSATTQIIETKLLVQRRNDLLAELDAINVKLGNK